FLRSPSPGWAQHLTRLPRCQEPRPPWRWAARTRRDWRAHWLSEGPRGPPLAFKTVRASFPAHGSSVVGPCPGYLARPWAVGAVAPSGAAGRTGGDPTG